MNTYIITALVSAILAASAVYKIDHWQFDAKEKERVEQQLQDQRAQASTAIRRIDNVSQAQSDAAKREVVLRRDANAARSELDGLRASAATALRVAQTSHAACTDASSKLKVVFLECSRNYEEVARDADLWESNAITLSDAWPR